jgi:hypothetical protein
MQSMTRGLVAGLLLVPCTEPVRVALAGSAMLAWPSRSDTVHVEPPTGARMTDRASIVAALERRRDVRAETYLVGGWIEVRVSQISFQGHGTVRRTP